MIKPFRVHKGFLENKTKNQLRTPELSFSQLGCCLCDNWKSSFLPRLIFKWFQRRVTAHWWGQWAINQVSTNQISRSRRCQIVRRTICWSATYWPWVASTWLSVIPPMVVDGSNPHSWWSRVSPGIIWYSFTDLGRIEGWVGLTAPGDLEICWYDVHGELNLGCLHGSTMAYPQC